MNKGRRPAESERRAVVSVRLPHPDEYFTETDLRWTFVIEDATPAAARLEAGDEVRAVSIKRNITVPAVMLTSSLGALGFAPEGETAEIRRALDVIGAEVAELGSGFRLTSGFARLRGRVTAVEGERVAVEIGVQLSQRRGEEEAAVTPEMMRKIFIKAV